MNYFKRHGIDLDVNISPDTHGTILPKFGGERKPPSVLLSSYYRPVSKVGRPRVVGSIFIHPDANKHLARICIAHEIFHLLCELHLWISTGRDKWQPIPMNDSLEDLCNQFAWALCEQHDKFNRSEDKRAEEIYFPPNLFKTPLDIVQTRNGIWPDGLAIDPRHPFKKRPPEE
ncbi:ImmA/IrrE family metallo-endopeptidase [Prosthecobacter sp.]|uniref:ImmA/IrrE family metallo-endopeptidase n=1 Tax=Prosthecobacter sp. TaxID=1965333 RepID=UPI0037846D28